MLQKHAVFLGNVPAGIGLEGARPNWHAFGILVAWSGANIVALQCYIWEFAHSLDASKLAVVATWLLYLAYLAIHARASLLRSNPWNLVGPAALIAVWGLTAPLLLWGMRQDLQMMRGYPAVEAIIVSCTNIFLSELSPGGMIAQNALYISVSNMELWARSPSTDIVTTARMLMGMALNFIWGTSVCCLLCLAHNRRTTLPYPSATTMAAAAAAAATTTAVTAAAAAGAPAHIHADATATADAQAAAHSHLTAGTPVKANTQPTIVPKEEAKGTAEKEPSSKSTPFVGSAFSASQPSPSLKPSAHPAAFGWAPALAKPLSLNNSLIAWVQRNELWLLAAVSQEDAQLFASLLSAMFVGTRFLTSVANYSVPGIVAMSPTMDMLAIVLGMMMGGSPDMQGWAAAQRRAYRSVRGLLRNIMPAHVADALEAYETERDHARPMCTFGVSSSTVAQGQPFSHSRRASCTSIVSSWEQSSSHSRRASYSALVRLTKPWLGPSQPCEESAPSRSANTGDCLPSLSSSTPFLERNSPPSSENKLERRRSFSERHEQVTVLFADIVGFTTLSDQLHPSEVMTLLCDLYKGYDERAVELGLYTVDTIGDCYMCAANLVKPLPNHVNVMVGFAQDIIEIANTTLSPLGTTLSIRVGIHTGPLMSGVIGVHRLKFTLVGDTVNVASRMESTAITNTLQISEHAYMLLRREQLAMLPEAAMGQSVDVGGFGDLPDMHGQGKSSCSMVRGDSAPPSLLAFLQDERGAALTELERFLGSSTVNRNGKALNSQAGRQEQQQHGQGQRREEKQQKQTPDGQQLQRQHCQEQQQQQQQQSFHSQPEAQGKKERWHSKLQESWCLGKSCSLSQGAVNSPCPEAPAEQSSHTLQPDGLDWDWLERKLDVKGKGIMKAYTYIGPSPPS